MALFPRISLVTIAVHILLIAQIIAEPLDPALLGVKHDVQLAADQRWLWTSAWHLPSGSDAGELFTDSQIIDLGLKGYDAMHLDIDANAGDIALFNKDFNTPFAMTVMAVKDRVYFVSSMKNNGFLYLPKSEDNPGGGQISHESHPHVARALTRCGSLDNGHRTQGKCGEPLASHAFFNEHPDDDGTGLEGARVVTIARISTRKTVIKPCAGKADTREWGCRQFVAEFGIRGVYDKLKKPPQDAYIPEGTEIRQPCFF